MPIYSLSVLWNLHRLFLEISNTKSQRYNYNVYLNWFVVENLFLNNFLYSSIEIIKHFAKENREKFMNTTCESIFEIIFMSWSILDDSLILDVFWAWISFCFSSIIIIVQFFTYSIRDSQKYNFQKTKIEMRINKIRHMETIQIS